MCPWQGVAPPHPQHTHTGTTAASESRLLNQAADILLKERITVYPLSIQTPTQHQKASCSRSSKGQALASITAQCQPPACVTLCAAAPRGPHRTKAHAACRAPPVQLHTQPSVCPSINCHPSSLTRLSQASLLLGSRRVLNWGAQPSRRQTTRATHPHNHPQSCLKPC